jgi:hypothetical protein
MSDSRAPERRTTEETRPVDEGLPILAPSGASPALASSPHRQLDHAHHAYESNPAPWWVALLWIVFLVGGAAYLVVNLMR